MWEITIPGTPVPQPRAKAFYNKKTGNMKHYYKNDKPLTEYKHKIEWRAQQLFKKPLACPISLYIIILMPRPKRMIWKRKPMVRTPHIKRPDIDNLAKTIFDALNEVAFKDDSQISHLEIRKIYHSGDEGPQTTIKIKEDGYEEGDLFSYFN